MKPLKLVAVCVLAALASCLAVSPAQAQSPSLDLIATDKATVLAKGVALSVKITYVCSGFDFADGYVSAQQRVRGGRIARGDGYFAMTCDGAIHVDNLIVTSHEFPFKKGEALVAAFAGGCGIDPDTQEWTCGDDSLSQVLRIR